MKKLSIFTTLFFAASSMLAQVYKTNTATISFESKTPVENIEATSKQAKAGVDSKTGAVQFSVAVNSFQFDKSLMQKHFQENYMETSKYANSSFSGKITNLSAVKWTTDGTYNVSVAGSLTIHGVKKSVTVPGKVVIKDGKPTLQATFKVKPQDYKIKIPGAVKNKIAKEVSITIDAACS